MLSTLEFDVVWEAARLTRRNVALDVPSPGITHAERAEFVRNAWTSLEGRGLARGGRVTSEMADTLALLVQEGEQTRPLVGDRWHVTRHDCDPSRQRIAC